MLNLLEFFKKLNTPYAYGIYCIIFGLGFLLLPARVMSTVIAVVGVLFILFGMTKLIIQLAKREKDPLRPFILFRDCVVIAIGVLLVAMRSSLSEIICSVFGVYLIIVAAIGIRRLLKVEKDNKDNLYTLDVVLTVILLCLGIWLCVYPLWPNVLLGISLIAAGARLLRSGKNTKPTYTKGKDYYPNKRDLYTEDYEDKTDQ